MSDTRSAAAQALLGLLLAPPIVAGFTWLLLRTSPYLALYLWAFLLALQLFFLTAYPIFIAPLFNRFDPLPPGPLRCVQPWCLRCSKLKLCL